MVREMPHSPEPENESERSCLITPAWIPGAHGPEGPVLDITGIRFEVNGKTLTWHRDPVNACEYHLEVPAGASMLHAHLQCVHSRATRVAAVSGDKDRGRDAYHSDGIGGI